MGNDRNFNTKGFREKFSENSLKGFLIGIIDAEIRKPISEMDLDLIGESVDLALEADGLKAAIPEEEIKSITKYIISKHYKPKRNTQ